MQPVDKNKKLTNLDLAITFPEAKSTLQALIKTDRQMLANYNAKMNKLRSWFALNSGYLFDIPTRDVDLLGVLFCNTRQHIIKEHATFNEVLDCQDRLDANQKILNLMGKKGHPQAVNRLETLRRVKGYPIHHLLEFNRAGFARCLWHDEATPSLKYYPKTNSVHCFGCARSEDVVGVVMTLNRLSFKEAILWLQSRM